MNTVLPRHIAIIMDGNGRWAKKRLLPRAAGHKAGLDTVRQVVKSCVEKKISTLTLFAFGNENWRRPEQEVDHLMGLFLSALKNEAKKLHEQNIQLRVIGNRARLSKKLCDYIVKAEKLTVNNTGLNLIIAVDYSGHWDVTTALQKIAEKIENGLLSKQSISPELIQAHLALADLPDPDLFIRTSGEQRISNFFLWQLAYTELYFTPVLWPDFTDDELNKALQFYTQRERRFGYTSEQLRAENHA